MKNVIECYICNEKINSFFSSLPIVIVNKGIKRVCEECYDVYTELKNEKEDKKNKTRKRTIINKIKEKGLL